MTISDYKKPRIIHRLVERAIRQVPTSSLKNFTAKVINSIKQEVNK